MVAMAAEGLIRADAVPMVVASDATEERADAVVGGAPAEAAAAKDGGEELSLGPNDNESSNRKSLSPTERAVERDGMVLDIKVKLKGWECQLTDEQFIVVKELLKIAITHANSRNDMPTIRDALEVSAKMYRKDPNNVQDYVQRHLLSLSVRYDCESVIESEENIIC
ncbi:hypothetical protein ABZP36_004820 [Zizania latifolia]